MKQLGPKTGTYEPPIIHEQPQIKKDLFDQIQKTHSDTIKFDDVYKTFKMLFCNPDTDDVLAFLYVYQQVINGRDLDDLRDEIEKNQEDTGYAYPRGFKTKH
jgi:hypothetical protein